VLGARGVVVHRIPLHTARVHAKLDGGAPFVRRVEHEGDEILVAMDTVAVDVRRADLRRLRVGAIDPDVEKPVVVRDPGRGGDDGRSAGIAADVFVELVELRGVRPRGVVEHAVEHDRRRRRVDRQCEQEGSG
jgi:hypothetical protein